MIYNSQYEVCKPLQLLAGNQRSTLHKPNPIWVYIAHTRIQKHTDTGIIPAARFTWSDPTNALIILHGPLLPIGCEMYHQFRKVLF